MRHLSTWLLALIAIFLLHPGRLSAQWIQEVKFDDSDMALDLTEAKSFQKYPNYYQYLQMMQDFASDYPDLCLLDTIGTSVEGRLLLALKISDNVEVDEAEASFLYASSMHGGEILGYVLLLRLADSLLSAYGQDTEVTRLVDQLQIWIHPLGNPDGSFSNDNNLSLTHATRHNINDIDLNRNYPDPDRGDADDTTGREQETKVMMEFMREQRFSMSANIHGGEEVVNYPWDDTPVPHADDDWFKFISHEYADEAMALDPSYMLGWPDRGITNGYEWYLARGTRQDYVTYFLGGREITLELSFELFLPSDQLEHHWNINHRSLFNYMAQCTYGIRGRVSDLDSGNPLHARIEVLMHDSAYSMIYSSADHGDYYRLIKEGSYDLVFSAPGYYSDTLRGVEVTDYQATLLDVQLEAWESSIVEQAAPSLQIYPNPSSGILYVEAANLPPGEMKLSIYSLEGKVLITKILPWNGEALELDISQLAHGLYFVHASMHSKAMVSRLAVIGP